MVDIFQILNFQADLIINQIKENLSISGTDATQKTSKSIKKRITKEGSTYRMVISGRPYFFTVETGRKPTPTKKPSPSMVDNIRAWLQARGKDEGLAWAVATSINKKGTKLYQQGGRTDIATDVINSKVEDITQAIIKQVSQDYLTTIKKHFDGSSNNTATNRV